MGFLGGAEIVGTTEGATPIREYFKRLGQPSKGSLEDDIEWDAMEGDGDLTAASRHLDQGGQVFLTREGYRHLRDQDMVVIRAQRVDPKAAWERLTLVWSPREVEP